MRTLLASEDPRAKLAVDLYLYRIRRELGSLAAALGGLDAVVFTAGIGENAAIIRSRVCRDAAWLGLDLDAAASGASGARISASDQSRVRVGHPHQRGADDRAPHTSPARGLTRADAATASWN